MDNYYYQPPNINQPPGYEPPGDFISANQNMYFIEKARLERREIRKVGNAIGLAMTAYVFVQIIASVILLSDGLYDKYLASPIFQASFNTIAVELCALVIPFGIMALINKKKYESDLIPTEKISAGKCFLWVGFGMLCCIGADYIVGFLVIIFDSFGHTLTQPETAPPNTLFACIISFVSTAVVPALCEEFSLRCCSLGLVKKYGKGIGVFCVSLVFGLLHGNVIQLVFATLVGLILGFVTVKTNSIIPAVLIHAFNNGMAAAGEILVYIFGEAADEYSTYAMFAFWFVLGGICAAILAFKGQFKREPKTVNYEPYKNSALRKIATFFFVPGMIIPFLFLVFETVMSVE